MNMTITSELLGAYLKCPMKCWLIANGEPSNGNAYAEWLAVESESYKSKTLASLQTDDPNATSIFSEPNDKFNALSLSQKLKTTEGKWTFNVNVEFTGDTKADIKRTKTNSAVDESIVSESGEENKTEKLKTCLHAVEKIRSTEISRTTKSIPTRFVLQNKLNSDELLLLVFDAYIISKSTSSEVEIGKIIHGDNKKIRKIKTSEHYSQLRRILKKISALIHNVEQPDISLNRHCPECIYQTRCRRIAIEKDCLSLIPNISDIERRRLRERGIFTITQYSYTFRPRRSARNRSENIPKFQSALKALAIREKKIHVVGNPKMQIVGTPVFFDVEGIPDLDFYYLIGVRVENSDSVKSCSFWANSNVDERGIWCDFCETLSTIDSPTLIHYGSYETTFISRMNQRYADVFEKYPKLENVFKNSVNLLSFIYGRIYFPTYSNGLKEIAKFVGFSWSDSELNGPISIVRRRNWESSKSEGIQSTLVTYNSEDCAALSFIAGYLHHLLLQPKSLSGLVQAEDIKNFRGIFGKNTFAITDMEEINKAAYWDYQRERILVKSNDKKLAAISKKPRRTFSYKVDKYIDLKAPLICMQCGASKLYPHQQGTKQIVDLKFGSNGVKRWVTNYKFYYFRCPACRAVFRNHEDDWIGLRYGSNLRAFCIYQIIELRISQGRVSSFLSRIFSIELKRAQISRIKTEAANAYKETYEAIKSDIISGGLIHADETQVSVNGKIGYVWVFTNIRQVIYIYSPSRDGEMVGLLLENFKGVLVTDFYAAYDSLDCPKQKCLIHLIRDLNEILYKEPFNNEFKILASKFTSVLRPIIETIDKFGLKKYHLRKHKADVNDFYQWLMRQSFSSESALKCRQRVQRNRESLFTFLDYDNIPWNNNNAEHAVKAFALLRLVFDGLSTEKGISDYLVLLSICETCRFQGTNFFDFLRSGRKDIGALAVKVSLK